MSIKIAVGLLVYALILLGLLKGIVSIWFGEVPNQPINLGWAMATINSLAAVISSLLGLKKNFKKCMLIILGGGGLRMGLMVVAVILMMQFKNEWLMPFSVSLLGCFVMYLFVEIGVIYKKGISTGNSQ